jgi:hypothetical protein
MIGGIALSRTGGARLQLRKIPGNELELFIAESPRQLVHNGRRPRTGFELLQLLE